MIRIKFKQLIRVKTEISMKYLIWELNKIFKKTKINLKLNLKTFLGNNI
jgi:hypothetical protein